MSRKEGGSSTGHWKLVIFFLFCNLIIISISPICAPRNQDDIVDRTAPAAITSQYIDSEGLSFSSDEEFRTWAILNGFPGDGSSLDPLYISELNVSGLSEPSLKLSNITSTWFIFENCIFQTHLWYGALDLTNVSKGSFFGCIVYGAVLLNNTAFSVIMDSYITDGVYIGDTVDSALIGNWFDVNANVYVSSIYIISNNISFYVNTFLGDLYLTYCTECYIFENLFFNSVIDDGFANTWDSNRYDDYTGTGPYIIPGMAESVDSNPSTIETTSIPFPPGPGPFTSPTTTTSPYVNTVDSVLFGIICFEIGVVIIVVSIRRMSNQ